MFHASFLAMGTRCHVILPGIDSEDGDRILSGIRMDVQGVEAKLSRYLPDSGLSRINREARMRPMVIDPELFEVLDACGRYHEATFGAFDITMRPLQAYWDRHPEGDGGDASFLDLRARTGMRHVRLDAASRSVELLNDTVELDLGGFGKGYALERVAERLRSMRIEDAFISFGESSILTLGRHPAGPHWRVGILRTDATGRCAHEFMVNDGSVSTSANARPEADGTVRTRRHVIDARSGRPVDVTLTVAVRADSPLDAEVFSTAALAMTDDERRDLRKRHPDVDLVTITQGSAEPCVTRI